ncbi:MAG TPA: hypothetical protein VHP11_05050, partial [Tepidisphaeraceae bacterium]|nr:hypothetical protein [Tepidisphaeraceae bacterium]
VRSKEDWARRREELKSAILYYEYGRMAPPPGNIKAEELSSTTNDQSGFVEKKILLTMGPDHKVSTHLELTIPSGKGPFPVIITGDLGWGKIKTPIQSLVIKRGYVLAEFNRTEIASDSKDRTQGVYPVYPQYDWGALSAWAWGYHRVIDYLVTQDYIDPARIAVTGHSRGGKATLLAGATDERIALTVPNNSGCGGAGCYRLQAEKSERIDDILKNFPYWFSPRFGQFIGKTDRLPFDQHSLKALIAPRALLTTEALGDLWANPEGTQQSHLAAGEVFDFLGASDRIGIYYRPGKHEQNEADWTVLLDFADRVMLGKTVDRKFDQLPFPNLPRPYHWATPTRDK